MQLKPRKEGLALQSRLASRETHPELVDLEVVGLIPEDNDDITPASLWATVFDLYSKDTFLNRVFKFTGFVRGRPGTDYGNSRYALSTFDYLESQNQKACVKTLGPDGMGGSPIRIWMCSGITTSPTSSQW
jgi:hypothetical protein